MLKIGNAQGFWGDSAIAPTRLIEQQPDLNYLTLDYLAEVSMSILAIQREKDPTGGYARDFLDVVRSLVPFWKRGLRFKLIANAGGLNPEGCAVACKEILQEEKCPHLRIGIVSGDDITTRIKSNVTHPLFRNLETHEPIRNIQDSLVTANAYLGAEPIAEALLAGADIVITGRVADPSLTVGPCLAHYGWATNDFNRIAGATIAGHLIECGTQVTGGISTNWLSVSDPGNIGYPVVEISKDGSCILTKPPHTGGIVNVETVKEQLLYEIEDPERYLSPDASVSFLSLALKEIGSNRVHITGAVGSPPPSTYKVSATYRDGYKAEGILAIFGPDAKIKGQRCGEVILERVKQAGYVLERTSIECIGCGAIVPAVLGESQFSSIECMLRICVSDRRKDALECFSKEVAGMVTSGPQGVTGYSSGRPHVRPMFGYWPCLIERSQIKPKVQIL